jgi:hypothetical protein
MHVVEGRAMRTWIQRGVVGVVAMVAVVVGAGDASAQATLPQQPRPEPGDVEVAAGLTLSGLSTDVNAWPACTSLALPCTHEHPGSFGGFGANLSVTRSIGQRAGITVAGEIAGFGFDSALEPETRRSSTDAVTALMAGPTFRTSFGHPRGARRQSDRFFGQVLVGVQHDSIFDTRPIIQVNAGADSLGPFGRRGGRGTFRIAAGYRFTPSASSASGGLWFFFGVVVGPRGQS